MLKTSGLSRVWGADGRHGQQEGAPVEGDAEGHAAGPEGAAPGSHLRQGHGRRKVSGGGKMGCYGVRVGVRVGASVMHSPKIGN